MIRRLLLWWRNRPCWTECYPPGWRSMTGIGMPCDECNELWEMDRRERQRQREEAASMATRPEYV